MPDTAGRDVAERLRQWRDERLNSEHVNPNYYSAARTELVSEAAYVIERLRDELAHWRKKTCESAKAYDRLSAEQQAAKEALTPFAAMAPFFVEGCLVARLRACDGEVIGITGGDLLRARDAISASPATIPARPDVPDGWQPMDAAPRSRPIIVLTKAGRIIKAKWVRLDDDNAGWGTPEEDDPRPRCWDDGFCWASNSDEEPSDPPICWIEIPSAMLAASPSPGREIRSLKDQTQAEDSEEVR